MLVLIILLSFIVIGSILVINNILGLGLILVILSTPFIIVHCVKFFSQGYQYNLYEQEYNSLKESLYYNRENGREIEAASVLNEVIEMNKDLATKKYKNKTILGYYIDDRFETLKPIR